MGAAFPSPAAFCILREQTLLSVDGIDKFGTYYTGVRLATDGFEYEVIPWEMPVEHPIPDEMACWEVNIWMNPDPKLRDAHAIACLHGQRPLHDFHSTYYYQRLKSVRTEFVGGCHPHWVKELKIAYLRCLSLVKGQDTSLAEDDVVESLQEFTFYIPPFEDDQEDCRILVQKWRSRICDDASDASYPMFSACPEPSPRVYMNCETPKAIVDHASKPMHSPKPSPRVYISCETPREDVREFPVGHIT